MLHSFFLLKVISLKTNAWRDGQSVAEYDSITEKVKKEVNNFSKLGKF